MKKIFTAQTGIIVLSLCAVLYLFFLSPGTKQRGNLNEIGKTYVDQTLPLLLADLRTENFFKYAGKGIMGSAPREDFDFMFDWFSRLGPLKACHEAYGEIVTAVFTDGREECTGDYAARVEFATGPAIVRLMIIKEGEDWKINGISIESKALMLE